MRTPISAIANFLCPARARAASLDVRQAPRIGALAGLKAAVVGTVALCLTPAQAAEFGVPVPVKTTRPATMNVAEVKAQVRKIYEAYRAIEVHYVQEVKHATASSKFIPKMKYSYAYKGERRLKTEKQLHDRPDQSGASYTFAFNGDYQQQYCDEPSQLTISKHKESFADIDAYINVLGVPMQSSERASAAKHPELLPGCFDVGKWIVLPTLDLVDGQDCHVLASTMGHRLWVDSTLGVVRSRETSVPGASNDAADWPINERFYYARHTQCRDGLWLPKLVKVDTFTSTNEPEHTLARQHILEVEDIRVNDDVPAELFTLTAPDGTIVNDTINKKFFKVGDPARGLDKIVILESKRHADDLWKSNVVRVNAAILLFVALCAIGRRLYTAPK